MFCYAPRCKFDLTIAGMNSLSSTLALQYQMTVILSLANEGSIAVLTTGVIPVALAAGTSLQPKATYVIDLHTILMKLNAW